MLKRFLLNLAKGKKSSMLDVQLEVRFVSSLLMEEVVPIWLHGHS